MGTLCRTNQQDPRHAIPVNLSGDPSSSTLHTGLQVPDYFLNVSWWVLSLRRWRTSPHSLSLGHHSLFELVVLKGIVFYQVESVDTPGVSRFGESIHSSQNCGGVGEVGGPHSFGLNPLLSTPLPPLV